MTVWKEARAALKAHFGVNSLLADPTDNPKLKKSLGISVMTAPLHLAPFNLSGYQVCPNATDGCAAACLHTAGNPAYMAGKQRARIARTQAFYQLRSDFMTCLAFEIASLEVAATYAGMRCGVRLNATSDLPWEAYALTWQGRTYRNICEAFPDVQFYDYTKRTNRRSLPANYHLTFSLAENNEEAAVATLARDANVAAVFAVKPGKPLPRAYELGGILWPVIDGDEHDFRPIDPRGVIVGLRAKGKARGDASGFVRAVS